MSVGHLPLAFFASVDLSGSQGVGPWHAIDGDRGAFETDGVGGITKHLDLDQLEQMLQDQTKGEDAANKAIEDELKAK